ncbi:MAG TPA: transglutaminase family protein [Bryobacteraceae bacterium]|jgi:transglutaminase-like putative cysteine protease|nr:transglutaminase family protein [Bryobacteraceae bacterium]
MAMDRYKLAHVTLFSYDGPVSESYNELRLRPRHDESQSCLSFRLTTNPASKPTAHLDYFNNWVHQFHILREHRELRVESEAIVLVHPPALQPGRAIPLDELDDRLEEWREENFDWLSASQYCPLSLELGELVGAAESRCDGTARGFSDSAAALIYETFTYKPGATHVHSSVGDCLATKAGVCQDFAHLLIAVLRKRGIPARYVSGYLVPRQTEDAQAAMENIIGGQASHAWVQANIPETGWIGLDPTVGSFVEEQHIVVARGRDYGDVPPVRGVYKGHAGQSLSVDVLVRPALDDEGAMLLQKTAAAPARKADAEEQQQQQQ